ncbi:MAG: endo-1,4-beta-xylanase [Spirochaetaceae bacterium]|jgi:GH35 family endo-1,4-beta-xylanase|nr:endo-1,4-beta-xylanase [Spirochaetaceae bacterium]
MLEHRKASIELSLKPNTSVHIEQKTSKFLFGCGGFPAVELYENGVSEERKAFLIDRLDKIFKICNYATLPFYWGRYEPVEGHPEEDNRRKAAEYFKARNVTLKGHPLCWHTVCADWLMQYDNNTILAKQLARIERDVTHFKGLIDIWDVINEVVIMPIFDKYDNAMTRVCKQLGRVKMIKEVFTAAYHANPKAVFLLNDFNTTDEYAILLDGCLNAGVPISVVGIQSHQHQGYWGLEKLNKVLERFSAFGLPIHFTENTLISGDLMPPHIVDLNDWQVDQWPSTPAGEERQAREVKEMYETLFAHPLVEAITTWDPADDAWLHAPAGLIRKDNSIKPVYTELEKLILHDWRSNADLVTDAQGKLNLTGFKGEYTLSYQNGEKVNFTLN